MGASEGELIAVVAEKKTRSQEEKKGDEALEKDHTHALASHSAFYKAVFQKR